MAAARLNDLIVVAVQDQRQHVELLQVLVVSVSEKALMQK
jgi:hypothetical protein